MLSVSNVRKSGLNDVYNYLLYRCQMSADVLSVLLAERLQVLLMPVPDRYCRRCGNEVVRGLKPHRCRKKRSEVISSGQQLNLEGCACKVKTLNGRTMIYCRCE